MRQFRVNFVDGTTWNEPDVWRLIWQDIPPKLNVDPYLPERSRSFTVIGKAVDLDQRWAEIVEMAREGHMDVREFYGVELINTEYWQVMFRKNYYCQMPKVSQAKLGHELHHKTLWWTRARADDSESVICHACYREWIYADPFQEVQLLP